MDGSEETARAEALSRSRAWGTGMAQKYGLGNECAYGKQGVFQGQRRGRATQAGLHWLQKSLDFVGTCVAISWL